MGCRGDGQGGGSKEQLAMIRANPSGRGVGKSLRVLRLFVTAMMKMTSTDQLT